MSNPADGAFRALDEDLMRAVLRTLSVCPGWVVMSGVSHVWRELVRTTPCRKLTIPRRPAGRVSLRQLSTFLNSWPGLTGRSATASLTAAAATTLRFDGVVTAGQTLSSLPLSPGGHGGRGMLVASETAGHHSECPRPPPVGIATRGNASLLAHT